MALELTCVMHRFHEKKDASTKDNYDDLASQSRDAFSGEGQSWATERRNVSDEWGKLLGLHRIPKERTLRNKLTLLTGQNQAAR